jgi:photosynthetic reaction center cytochrome c subunit
MRSAARLAGIRCFSIALAGSSLLLVACERPPVATTQIGYRGLGMVEVDNSRLKQERLAAQQVPEPLPPVAAEGPTAAEAYQNVQVLGDLTVPEFNRLMAALTTWVSPEQGCVYCHAGTDLASDDVYTKVVSRRMIEMTRHINSQWKTHVGETGVTCYTCHRGQPVPRYVWYTAPDPDRARGLTASSAGQNIAAEAVGFASLPYDPFTTFLDRAEDIRVVSASALPQGGFLSLKAAEQTYGLMMHVSQSLGVNCVFCHNSRSFKAWDQSPPQRATAWYGIRLVRDLNAGFLEPLRAAFPAERLGPLGDAPKTNCATCHQGLSRPLGGASLVQHYPELARAHAAAHDQMSPDEPQPQGEVDPAPVPSDEAPGADAAAPPPPAAVAVRLGAARG